MILSFLYTFLHVVIIIMGIILCLLCLYQLMRRSSLWELIELHVLLRNRVPVDDYYRTIDIVIANEIVIYERYLTNSTDFDITVPLTSSQFINFYEDICQRILKAVPDRFYKVGALYVTKEETQTYMCQRVYSYLAEKINPPMDDDEEEDEE